MLTTSIFGRKKNILTKKNISTDDRKNDIIARHQLVTGYVSHVFAELAHTALPHKNWTWKNLFLAPGTRSCHSEKCFQQWTTVYWWLYTKIFIWFRSERHLFSICILVANFLPCKWRPWLKRPHGVKGETRYSEQKQLQTARLNYWFSTEISIQ